MAGVEVGGAGTGADGEETGAAGAWPRPAATTSLRVMRPPSPVPRIFDGSSPCSAIMWRTSGDVTGAPGEATSGGADGAGADATGADVTGVDGVGAGVDGALAAGATGAHAGAGFVSPALGSTTGV
ncbi:MAG TPA: hypothetical protein VK771_03150, partial [Acidimicrobiia bacterium]|nr:hypothetical protein [Acidimicrobiia bacterium]